MRSARSNPIVCEPVRLVLFPMWTYFDDLSTHMPCNRRCFFASPLKTHDIYRIHILRFHRWKHSKTIIRAMNIFSRYHSKPKCSPRVYSMYTKSCVFAMILAPFARSGIWGRLRFLRSRHQRSQHFATLKDFFMSDAFKGYRYVFCMWGHYMKMKKLITPFAIFKKE